MIPAKLKIGAITYQVKEVEAAEIDCDNHCAGDQSDHTQVIRIAKNLSPEMKEVTLLHEILHCIDGQLDHDLVELISGALYQVIAENDVFRRRV